MLLHSLFQFGDCVRIGGLVHNKVDMKFRAGGQSVFYFHVVTGVDHIERHIGESRLYICRGFPFLRGEVWQHRIASFIVAVHRQAVRFNKGLFAAVALDQSATGVFAVCIFGAHMVILCRFL